MIDQLTSFLFLYIFNKIDKLFNNANKENHCQNPTNIWSKHLASKSGAIKIQKSRKNKIRKKLKNTKNMQFAVKKN